MAASRDNDAADFFGRRFDNDSNRTEAIDASVPRTLRNNLRLLEAVNVVDGVLRDVVEG
jgi:hypothetical protein